MSGLETALAALPEHSLLRALDIGARDALLARAARRERPAGTLIVEQGARGDSLMVLLTGTAKVSAMLLSGREVVFDILRPGAVIGELAVLDGSPRSANVTAMERCALLIVDRREIVRLLEARSDLALAVIGTLTRRLRQANLRVEGAGLGVAVQLARGLLRLAREYGRKDASGVLCLPFRLNQSVLAGYVSLSREKVNRQLKLWEAEELLASEKGQLRILDSEALEEIAEGPE